MHYRVVLLVVEAISFVTSSKLLNDNQQIRLVEDFSLNSWILCIFVGTTSIFRSLSKLSFVVGPMKNHVMLSLYLVYFLLSSWSKKLWGV